MDDITDTTDLDFTEEFSKYTNDQSVCELTSCMCNLCVFYTAKNEIIDNRINNIITAYELPENKFTTDHPLTIVQNKNITLPEITSNHLSIDDQSVEMIFTNTLIYLHLQILSVKNNPLTFLADIYTLTTLDCSNCKLRSLPTYMPVLTNLNCANNLINHIPNYKNLIQLDCSNNIIGNVDHLTKLKHLKINNNPTTQVNIQSLTYLEAYDCPILILYDLPGLVRRSSTLDMDKSFKWITTKMEKVNKDHILVNWSAHTVNDKLTDILRKKSAFWYKLIKVVF